MYPQSFSDWAYNIFQARLTDVFFETGTELFAYSFVGLYQDASTGALVDSQPPRSGEFCAYGLNNREIDVTDEPVVWMRVRGSRAGVVIYEFDDSAHVASSSGSRNWVRCQKIVTHAYCLNNLFYYTAVFMYIDVDGRILFISDDPCPGSGG